MSHKSGGLGFALAWSLSLVASVGGCGEDAVVRPAVFTTSGGTGAVGDAHTASGDTAVAETASADQSRGADFGLPPDLGGLADPGSADTDPEVAPPDADPALDGDPTPDAEIALDSTDDALLSDDAGADLPTAQEVTPDPDADPVDTGPVADGQVGPDAPSDADVVPAPDAPLPDAVAPPDVGADLPPPDSQADLGAELAQDTAPDLPPACPGNVGCACKFNGDCKAGVCIVNAAGAQVCGDPCDAKVKPSEVCNGLDDDCDGAADEGTCEDGNACTADTCDPGKGCVFSTLTAPCSDGNACTVADACAAGACKAGAGAQCADGNPCTDDACNPLNGCAFSPNSAPCKDPGNCSTNDVCKNSACTAGAPVQCDDGNPCTQDSCGPATACTNTPTAGPCSDGNVCSVGDLCGQAGTCVGGPPLSCDDGNPCTADGCDKAKGCTHSAASGPCSDNNVCTQGDACGNGACVSGLPLTCADGNPCTADACDPNKGCVFAPVAAPCSDANACTAAETCSAGQCGGGKPVTCNDSNPCTTDACDSKLGCTYAANTAACNDGNACTTGDVCASGSCVIGKPTVCNDNKPCTTDSCAPTTGCTYTANALPCDDGNACSAKDTCSGGLCVAGNPLTCNDNNVCTADACVPASGCSYTPAANACSDGNACTANDLCTAGQCKAGAAVVCDDKNSCTFDTCDAGKGCTVANLALPCDDGSVCTVGDVCKDGKCAAGAPVTCNDGNPCTTDACDKAKGCTVTPNNSACNDNNACTAGDACKSGACAGTPTPCNDSNPCTDDYCDASKGCQAVANALPCNDNTACTKDDLCKSGKCAGAALDCDDKNPCTIDGCDAAKGCTHTAVANNTKCGDVGVCLTGSCSPGADINPATSCKAIKAAWPAAPTGTYWLDPDGPIGAGSKYQAGCDMVKYGGGWMVIDNAWAFKLLTMTNVNPTQGKCQLTASEWRTWDGFDGAPGSTHFCVAERLSKNWPSYNELRYEGLQLIGYTGGGGNVFDLGLDCYGTIYVGGFCAGPLSSLVPPNTTTMTLGNGVKSPVFTKLQTFPSAVADFQIRAREEGPQLEGVVWNTGAILLR